ncbi:MAG: WG repeat-containing protein [Bacteroidales bacterium]|nr:WG repeat-containing protein [Bacteroidales bacterium]MBR5777972.1 WG repeat-containing protein [Bacteroidales bacterium]
MKKIYFLFLFGAMFSIASAQKVKPLYDQFSNAWGYVNNANMWVISPSFDAAENFTSDKNGVAAVKKENGWGAIDSKGNFVVEPIFEFSNQAIEAYYQQGTTNAINEWVLMVKDPETGKFGFANCKGVWVIKPQYDVATDFTDFDYKRYSTVKKGEKWGCISDKGELVVKVVFETQDQATDAGYQWHKNEPLGVWLYPARDTKGTWGYVNYKGDWAIKPIYEYAQEFVGDRYNRCAVVKIDGSWGCVNDRGKYVVDPKFPYAGQAVRAGFDWRKSK